MRATRADLLVKVSATRHPIENLLVHHADKEGLYHVSSASIDKYTLLTKLQDRLNLEIEIRPDDEFVCNRSLDSSRFRNEFDYEPPPWDKMLDELSNQIKARNA